jgi:hypothetical protein
MYKHQYILKENEKSEGLSTPHHEILPFETPGQRSKRRSLHKKSAKGGTEVITRAAGSMFVCFVEVPPSNHDKCPPICFTQAPSKLFSIYTYVPQWYWLVSMWCQWPHLNHSLIMDLLDSCYKALFELTKCPTRHAPILWTILSVCLAPAAHCS